MPNLFHLFLATLALLSNITQVHSQQDVTEETLPSIIAAQERLYYYAMYDLDCHVWGGPGKGYIATNCTGTGVDGRCTLDQFINFIEFGTASDTPSYYELDNGFYFTIGSIWQIGDALKAIYDKGGIPGTRPWNLVSGRQSMAGIWKDMGNIFDNNVQRAKDFGIDVSRHVSNAHMIMGAITMHQRALLNVKTWRHFANEIKDVIWQTVERQEMAVKGKWTEIDWEKMVQRYPDLADPYSSRYKALRSSLLKFQKIDINRELRDRGYKASNTGKDCFRYA